MKLSILDLVPVPSGTEPAAAVRRMLDLARLAERLGFVRLWYAEHHGMAAIGSSSPEILIAHAAAVTSRIRIGSGGIMLPNHAPIRIAEAFQTLEALYPGRIDLGLGRAPGTDPRTSSALRPFDGEAFPELIGEMVALSGQTLPPEHPLSGVKVVPSGVPLPPIWILGSSGATARMAGLLGTGYGFASHFSPTPPGPALEAYRQNFKPSGNFPRPHVIVGASVIVAESDEEARYLASSLDLSWVRLSRNEYLPFPSPEEALAYPYTDRDRAVAASYRSLHIIGTPASVHDRIRELVSTTAADEVMVTTLVHDHDERLRSYELLAEAFGAA